MLLVEHYSVQWLHRAGNKIGINLKIDAATLPTSRGKYARVCVEVDLCKPLKSGYQLRDQLWKVRYKSLKIVYFHYGRYGHGEFACPIKINWGGGGKFACITTSICS